jgi:hypothetical protein
MLCADLIVCRLLKNVMAGMSLGAALLDSKQRFLADIRKNGQMPDASEEKTLLQFLLLGDPSLRAVTSREERDVVISVVTAVGNNLVPAGRSAADKSGEIRFHLERNAPLGAATVERRRRRDHQARMARTLRQTLPERERIEPPFTAGKILNDVELAYLGARQPIVDKVTRTTTPVRRAVTRAVSAAMSTVGVETEPATTLPVQEETLQYYWFIRTPRERVIDITIVKVETDMHGNVLRKRALVSA